jgi:ADP-L-glycero-D-manno-heptose 6-epimerase
MASVVWQFFNQYGRRQGAALRGLRVHARPTEELAHFVSIDDVVAVNLDFLDHPERSGIFNLGTGAAATFNAVAAATINACRAADGAAPLAFDALHRAGAVEYIAFPPGLAARYQSYTQADIGRLRGAGYVAPMQGVEAGVPRCVHALLAQSRVNP